MNTEQHTDRLPIAGPLIAGPPRPIPAHAAILPDLVAWADQIDGLATSGVSAEDLAGLLIHSRHLQSIARAQQDAILPILNGTGAAIIDAAVNTLFDVADTAADDAAMMAAIRHLRQRSGLATALADLANKADVGTQMNWLSTKALPPGINKCEEGQAGLCEYAVTGNRGIQAAGSWVGQVQASLSK